MARRRRPKPIPKKCSKCGKTGDVQYHHILPWSIFKDNDYGIYLCKDCHKSAHEYLGWKYTHRKNAQDKDFYHKKFWTWFMLTMIVVLILAFLR